RWPAAGASRRRRLVTPFPNSRANNGAARAWSRRPPALYCSRLTERGLDMTLTVNPNQVLWEKGDFTRIAATMRESGEALVASLGVTKGQKVLDLGCGDGTTALPAAKLGADVLGLDIARNLVEAGNRRAAEHGLTNLRFQE